PGGRESSLSVVGLDGHACAEDRALIFAPGTLGDETALARSLDDSNVAFATTIVAEQYGLRPGAKALLRTPAGNQQVTIAAEIVDYTQNGYALVLGEKWVRAWYGAKAANVVTVRV